MLLEIGVNVENEKSVILFIIENALRRDSIHGLVVHVQRKQILQQLHHNLFNDLLRYGTPVFFFILNIACESEVC